MNLTNEQKFLYSRVAILITGVLAIASVAAGFHGFHFWYGFFVVCFTLCVGLINWKQHTTVWLAIARPRIFLLLYATLVVTSFFGDQFGLNLTLWFYPYYHGAGFLWVYFVLYPFGGLAVLELLYVLAGALDEPLVFKEHAATSFHHTVDVVENVLVLVGTLLAVLGAAGVPVPFSLSVGTVLLWFVAVFFKLKLHIRHPGHYTLVILLSTFLSLVIYHFPNTIAREWVYLDAPFFDRRVLGVPLFVFLGWYVLTLVPLRLWIYLVLHPKMK